MDIKKICSDLNFTSLYWTNQYIQKVCRKLELNWTERNWMEKYIKKKLPHIYMYVLVFIYAKNR